MIFKDRPKLFACLVAAGVALYAPAPFLAAQSEGTPAAKSASASTPTLDYEFFKTRVEPIFLKKRFPNHARCYVCHSAGVAAPPYLLKLSPGNDFWTEEQSRRNFQVISHMVVPGNPAKSPLLMHPLAPEAGGDAVNVHGGGRQFESQNDPDWQIIAEWIRGKKSRRLHSLLIGRV